jgi:hypothetical protein
MKARTKKTVAAQNEFVFVAVLGEQLRLDAWLRVYGMFSKGGGK